MHIHWAELVDSLCDLRGTFNVEFSDIERSVAVARGYVRDLRFPLMLQELADSILDGAALEADGLLSDEADMHSLHCPTVLALTFAAHGLLYGEGENRNSRLEEAEIEMGCRRVGAFVLIEKMRRLEVYGKMRLPFDPWDDETPVICEDVNEENERSFKRWLGYTVED